MISSRRSCLDSRQDWRLISSLSSFSAPPSPLATPPLPHFPPSLPHYYLSLPPYYHHFPSHSICPLRPFGFVRLHVVFLLFIHFSLFWIHLCFPFCRDQWHRRRCDKIFNSYKNASNVLLSFHISSRLACLWLPTLHKLYYPCYRNLYCFLTDNKTINFGMMEAARNFHTVKPITEFLGLLALRSDLKGYLCDLFPKFIPLISHPG